MAFKLRATEPTFLFDISTATNDVCDDLYEIFGFLGEWQNPSHILVSLDNDLWCIGINEIEVRLVDDSVPDWDFSKLGVPAYDVWFTYIGNDRNFIRAFIDWVQTDNTKG